MLDVAEAWLKSGKYSEMAGLRLRPIENPKFKGLPLSTARGQAQAYYLRDDNNFDWIMKKFLPAKIPDSTYINAIQSLIPPRPGFQAGYRRRVLSGSDVARSGFYSADFAAWVENTVLMSRITCDDWAGLADKIRKGSVTLTDAERILMCRSLSEKINLLESSDLSHRDLSVMNVFVEVKTSFVHLIDWDCLFHPSLSMPRNTTYGTEGYIAPFVKKSGVPDPQITWKPRADRFSLAILNAEFLCMDAGTPLRNDGGMFEQTELYNGGGPETTQILNKLRQNFPDAGSLLEKALTAQSFDDCPSPDKWLALGVASHIPAVNPASILAPAPTSSPRAAPQANLNSFVLLDETALVRLDERAFVPSL